MKTFEQFMPFVLPFAPGCSETAAENALLLALRQFCERTRAWRANLDPMTLVPGIDEYELELPERSELVRIESAKLNGTDISVAMPDNPPSRYRTFIECVDGKLMTVNPVPQATTPLVLRVSLKPALNAVGSEDFIYDRHAEVLAKGALAILKAQPMRSYSDKDGALSKEAEFRDDCADIRNTVWRGNANNTARSRPTWF